MNPDLATAATPRAVVLVEGMSDREALEALAERRGRSLAAEGVAIVSIGGATNIGRFLERFGPQGLNLRLAGLCDAAEEGYFRRGLERAGFGADLSRADMEELGFFVCVEDLEDELIRSLGVASVQRTVDAQGELGRSASCRSSRPSEDARSTSSFAGSWGPGPAGRVVTPGARRRA